MAGLGRKVFQPGEVLTATNVQNYLMDQAVQVYADSAARGSAIGSATTEGMVSYLADTNFMQVATGTAVWQDVNVKMSPNFLLNGGFDVWQRGTATVTTNGAYSSDRWIIGSSAGTNAVTQSTDVPSNIGAVYSLQFAGTSTTNPRIRQRIESINANIFAGQTVTLSFYAKSTAGTAAIKVDTAYPTSTADTFGTWASPTVTADQSALAVTPTGNASTSWTRYAVTFTVNALATRGYQVDLYRESTTTSSTTLFAGVQLELGSVATPFRRNAPSIQGELAACQRYYYRVVADSNYTLFGVGQAYSTTQARINVPFPVTMRRVPDAPEWTTTAANYAFSASETFTSIASSVLATKYTGAIETVGTFTNKQALMLIANNNTTAYIGFSAEL